LGFSQVLNGKNEFTILLLKNDFYLFSLIDKMTKEPLELIPLKRLITHSPYEIVNIFPILDRIKEIKYYRIKLTDDIILNVHKRKYNSINEIVEDADYMFNNFEEFIDIYDLNTYYSHVNLCDFNNTISIYKAKFFRDFSLLLSSLPYDLTRNNKTIEEMEMSIIKKFL